MIFTFWFVNTERIRFVAGILAFSSFWNTFRRPAETFVFTNIRDWGKDTSFVRITRVFSTLVVIVTSGFSVNTSFNKIAITFFTFVTSFTFQWVSDAV